MLYGIINEQGNCLDARDDISEKYTIFEKVYMFSYKSLAPGALILEIIVIATNKIIDLSYRCYITFLLHIS